MISTAVIVGEITAIDCANTVGKPSALDRRPLDTSRVSDFASMSFAIGTTSLELGDVLTHREQLPQ